MAKLKFLTDEKGAVFVSQIWVVRATRELGCLVALLGEDGVTTPVLVLTIRHCNRFDHVSGGDVGKGATDSHDNRR